MEKSKRTCNKLEANVLVIRLSIHYMFSLYISYNYKNA